MFYQLIEIECKMMFMEKQQRWIFLLLHILMECQNASFRQMPLFVSQEAKLGSYNLESQLNLHWPQDDQDCPHIA